MKILNRIIILAIIMISINIQGCASNNDSGQQGGDESANFSAAEDVNGEEGEEYVMNEATVKIIMEKVNCTEEQAQRVDARLGKLEIKDIKDVESAEKEDNSIVVTDENDKKYEIGIDKIWRVYSVKDIEQDKYLFAVYE